MDPITMLNVVNGVNNLVNGNDDAEKQQQYNLDLMKQQYEYGQKGAQQQMQNAKEMFEYTGPANRVRQLKEAGLNPGLIYGMGGGGGGTASEGAAPSTGLPSAPNVAQTTGNKIQQEGMMLQMAKMQSEIELNKAAAAEKTANATITSGAETQVKTAQADNLQASIGLITQQTNSEQIKQTGYDLQNSLNKIDLQVKTATAENDINRIAYLTRETKYAAEKMIEEYRISQADASVKTHTINTMIEQYNANLQNTMADIMVKQTEGAVNTERAKQITASVVQEYIKLRQGNEQLRLTDEQMTNMLKLNKMSNDASMDRLNKQGWFNILNGLIGAASKTGTTIITAP